eukprot:gene2825-3118_t
MSGQGPSVGDIAKARNQKLGQEQKLTAREVDRVAAELKDAHEDALRIKREAEDRGESSPTAQNLLSGPLATDGAAGNPAAAYEGVVFASDDPEYRAPAKAHPTTETAQQGRGAAEAPAAADDGTRNTDSTEPAVTDIGDSLFSKESVLSVVTAAGQPVLPTPREVAAQTQFPEATAESQSPAFTLAELQAGKSRDISNSEYSQM